MNPPPTLNAPFLAQKQAAYDAAAKRFLSTRIILAWILKYCVEEFKGYDIGIIAKRCIIEKPEVGTTPLEPDKTNIPPRILGDNVENTTTTEGTVTFDIRFRARTLEGEPLTLIINLEAQRRHNPGYTLLKRVLFYCSRLLSSEYGVEFQHAEYDKLKKVYSIWICMTSPGGEESGITEYRIEENPLYGKILQNRQNYDVQRAIMVYIGSNEKKLGNQLLRLLYLIFRAPMQADPKLKQLKDEFQIDLQPINRKVVATMCNLSYGLVEEGMAKGMAQGRAEGMAKGIQQERENMALSMLKEKSIPMETIAKITHYSLEQIQELAKRHRL